MAIFNSLLRITDIETSAKTAGFKDTNISLVVEDAIELYQPIIEDKAILLSAIVEPDLELFCDKNLLFQAFANVIDNAVKFTPSGGQITVALKSNKEDNSYEFQVNDSGIGVNEEVIDKLTQRFYREDKSRTASGNGLGLSLVSAIVSLHKGTIEFGHTLIDTQSGLRCQISLPM
jgi:signal transduction histidine kinase